MVFFVVGCCWFFIQDLHCNCDVVRSFLHIKYWLTDFFVSTSGEGGIQSRQAFTSGVSDHWCTCQGFTVRSFNTVPIMAFSFADPSCLPSRSSSYVSRWSWQAISCRKSCRYWAFTGWLMSQMLFGTDNWYVLIILFCVWRVLTSLHTTYRLNQKTTLYLPLQTSIWFCTSQHLKLWMWLG